MKSITIFCLFGSALGELSSTFVGHDASKLALLNSNSPSLLREQDGEEKSAQVPLGETATQKEEMRCKHPPYQMHIFSKSPLVMYLSGFLTEFERSYLMNVSEGTFSHSVVVSPTGLEVAHDVRSSDSAVLSPDDDVVRCIEERAAEFQGLDMPIEQLEITQLVRYGKGARYAWHTDWFDQHAENTAAKGGNRISSFFVYVDVGPGTLGGGTNFPVLDAPLDRRWCDRGFVDCDDEWEAGVTFSPLPGNGVFWENLANDGSSRGDHRVLHAGSPVLRGTKMGMNIWTREGRLPEYIVDDGRR